jgi:hypothetical protein
MPFGGLWFVFPGLVTWTAFNRAKPGHSRLFLSLKFIRFRIEYASRFTFGTVGTERSNYQVFSIFPLVDAKRFHGLTEKLHGLASEEIRGRFARALFDFIDGHDNSSLFVVCFQAL